MAVYFKTDGRILSMLWFYLCVYEAAKNNLPVDALPKGKA